MKQSKLHLYLTLLWVVPGVPVVIYWRHSILLVLLVSVYANIATHWGAYQSSRAKEVVEDDVAEHQ